jgi:hypothetical protein
MTGPHPAGRPWTRAEEAELRELIASKVKVGQIAKKLKRSPGAIYARINSLKKLPRDLPFSAQSRSLPSERLAAYAMAEISENEADQRYHCANLADSVT